MTKMLEVAFPLEYQLAEFRNRFTQTCFSDVFWDAKRLATYFHGW